MRVLLWHVHGSWTTAFVHGSHDYVLPVLPDRSADGLGRARTWHWPATTVERAPAQLCEEEIDVVVLQRPHELELTRRWTGRTPGRDVAAVYLEHNAPEPYAATSRHPFADRHDIPIVHVTHFNRLFWGNGATRTRVIEHGVVDPGPLYTGEIRHAVAVINEPVRRARITGTDLLADLGRSDPIDLFGMHDGPVAGVTHAGDLPQDQMHRAMAQRRVYLHTSRWTSLGLSLIEAMHMGLPVVAVDATEVARAVPSQAGTVSCDLDALRTAVRHYLNEPEAARVAGKAARAHALEHYGLDRFLADWDDCLKEVTS